MTLSQIRTTNIQTHKSIVIDLPETGIVRLAGPNSSGKSVTYKVLIATLEKKIAKPKVRGALISKGCQYGEATYVRSDGWELTIHLAIAASDTWVSLKKAENDITVRYLADKNYRDLALEFGFHYNDDRGISINIAEGDKSILFYTTSGPTNYDIVDIALSDAYATHVLEGLEETTKTARDFRDKSLTAIQIIDSALSELQVYDTVKISKRLDELIGYFDILSSIYIPQIPKVEAVPNVRSLNIYKPSIPTIRLPKVVDVRANLPQMPDIVSIAKEIATLKSNVCPTCGRSFGC